ncbi:MAG: ferrochelatase [Gemmatimonadetes bacterium]|nr:ferrochelatase [Gemmatimonadota bacterium]
MTIRGANSPDTPLVDTPRSYDAVLVMSFGGPEGPDDVMPFLENVTRGRNIPPERLLHVAEHYQHFGGVSPINRQNRKLIAALARELSAYGPRLPIYFGNRNWHPFITDTVRQMRDNGVKRAIAFVTAGFSCFSGCRQYREDIVRAIDAVGEGAPEIDKLRVFYNHPGFIEPTVEGLTAALGTIPPGRREKARVVFTAHSIPAGMATSSAYERQFGEASRLVAEAAGVESRYQIAYQSRSGSPQAPWLEPDILDVIAKLAADGNADVVVQPIGFISDHIEVLWDLDEEAKEKAGSLGINFVRAATVGTHPRFVAMIRELILERMTPTANRKAVGEFGPNHDVCPVDCCLMGGKPTGAAPRSVPASPGG